MPSSASISVHYNYQNAVWKLPYAARIGGKTVPSYAAKLARRAPGRRQGVPARLFDSIPHTIPSISAAAVLTGTVPARQVARQGRRRRHLFRCGGRPIFHSRMGQDGRRLRPGHRRRDAAMRDRRSISAGCLPICSALALAAICRASRQPRTADGHPRRRRSPRCCSARRCWKRNLIFVDITPACS